MPNADDGIQMIWPTSIGGEIWYLSTNPTKDPRFNSHGKIDGNYTDGFQCTVDPETIAIETSIGYDKGSISKTVDHSFIASTGFMYRSNDWRDCEMTGYFDCHNVTNTDARIQMFARSAEIGEQRQWCPGTYYLGELAMDGRFRWCKNQYYLSSDNLEWIESSFVGLTSNLVTRNPAGTGAWFGLKIVMNNEDIGDGKQGVRLYAYVDKLANNTWSLISTSDVLDRGGWGKDGEYCKGYADQIITWGGPLASFRFENGSQDIIFKKLSVREVDVGGEFIQPVASPLTAQAAAGAFQRVLAMSTMRYRVGTSIIPTCIGEIPTDPDPPPPPDGPGDPPPGGSVFVESRLAHGYKINSSRTAIVGIDEFPAG